MKNKLGRKPMLWRPRLHFAKYANRSIIKLPDTRPLNIGYSNVIPGMLCNGPDPMNPPQIPDGIGCCFAAAILRMSFARAVSSGKYQGYDLTQSWAIASMLEFYSGSTGFDINNAAATDNGTDPDVGFKYAQTVGIRMPDGMFDKIGVPVSVNAKDWEEVLLAHNLFGGLYQGVQFPDAWENAPVWDALKHPNIVGGHETSDLSDVGISPDGIETGTWGEARIITPAGLAQFCDQLTCVVDPGFFGPSGTAINGFDAEQLQADEAAIS